MNDKIRIYIVDDHKMFIEGITALLKLRSNVEIVGTSTSAIKAVMEIQEFRPDILITDINMPEMNGEELTKSMRNKMPELLILCLSMHKDIEFIDRMMNAGANAYLLKNTGVKELFEAIDRILNGEIFYSKEVKEIIIDRYNQKSMAPKVVKQQKRKAILTKREKQIIKLIMQGMPSAEIADELKLSYYTITTHRKNIYTKLNISKVSELLDYVKENGLVLD